MVKKKEKAPPAGFTASIEIDAKRVQDLLCCAFEGGSNYWYVIDHYEYADGYKAGDFEYPHIDVPITEGCAVIIADAEGGNKKHRLDRVAIQRGLDVMREKYPRQYGDFLSENDDADTGDTFLQCCLFGEAIYG